MYDSHMHVQVGHNNAERQSLAFILALVCAHVSLIVQMHVVHGPCLLYHVCLAHACTVTAQ